jgi:hypothetical protein
MRDQRLRRVANQVLAAEGSDKAASRTRHLATDRPIGTAHPPMQLPSGPANQRDQIEQLTDARDALTQLVRPAA